MLDLAACLMFLIDRWIRYKDYTLSPAFEESHGEEDDERIWIEYYVFFILVFLCAI